MERYIWVKNARARFADVLNTAAYGSERIVILRRGEELAFVGGVADLDFLRRHRSLSRYPEPPPDERPLGAEDVALANRQAKLAVLEQLLEKGWGGPGLEREIAEERASIASARAALFRI